MSELNPLSRMWKLCYVIFQTKNDKTIYKISNLNKPIPYITHRSQSSQQDLCAHCRIFHPSIHGLNVRRCPMSPHFLTRWVSRLLGLALVSWAFARVFCPSPFPLPSISRCYSIHSSSPATGFHSCVFCTAVVSAPIRSTLHLLTF